MNHDELWQQHALCSRPEHDPGMWFPEKGEGDEARRVCAACPVRRDCLENALDRGEEHGIWGGAGELTRRALRALDRHHRGIEIADHFDRLDEFAVTGKMPTGQLLAFGPGATHGRKSTYKRGCRGDDCMTAMGFRPRGNPCPTRPEAEAL